MDSGRHKQDQPRRYRRPAPQMVQLFDSSDSEDEPEPKSGYHGPYFPEKRKGIFAAGSDSSSSLSGEKGTQEQLEDEIMNLVGATPSQTSRPPPPLPENPSRSTGRPSAPTRSNALYPSTSRPTSSAQVSQAPSNLTNPTNFVGHEAYQRPSSAERRQREAKAAEENRRVMLAFSEATQGLDCIFDDDSDDEKPKQSIGRRMSNTLRRLSGSFASDGKGKSRRDSAGSLIRSMTKRESDASKKSKK